MSLTATNRGTGNHNTGATSVACSPTSNFTAGKMAVLFIAYDNAGSGGADPFSSIIDSVGNTWTSRQAILFDPGAASAGIAGRIFTCPQDIGQITTGTTVTVSFGAVSVVAKAWTFIEVNASVGIATFRTGGTGTGGNQASPNVVTASVTSGECAICGVVSETNNALTGDSDTTNGSWSTAQTTSAGSGATGVSIITQQKVVTGTGTQSYTATHTAADCIAAYIIVQEITVTNVTPDPTVATFVVPDPTIGKGTVGLTPSPTSASFVVPDPTIGIGTVGLTPDPTHATFTVPTPTVQTGQDIQPDPTVATFAVPAPTVAAGGVNVAPDPVSASFVVPDPAVTKGALDVAPSPVVATFVVPDPALTVGAVNATPSPVVATFAVPDPEVRNGNTLAPDPVAATFAVPAPALTPGAVNVAPDPVAATFAVPTPAVTSSYGLTPDPVSMTLAVPAPTLTAGAANLTPDPVVMTLAVPDPVVSYPDEIQLALDIVGEAVVTIGLKVEQASVGGDGAGVGGHSFPPDEEPQPKPRPTSVDWSGTQWAGVTGLDEEETEEPLTRAAAAVPLEAPRTPARLVEPDATFVLPVPAAEQAVALDVRSEALVEVQLTVERERDRRLAFSAWGSAKVEIGLAVEAGQSFWNRVT